MKLPQIKWPSIKVPKIDGYHWLWAVLFSAAMSFMARLAPELGMLIIATWGLTMTHFGYLRIETKFLKLRLEELEKQAVDNQGWACNLQKESIDRKIRADKYEIAAADWQRRCSEQHDSLKFADSLLKEKNEAITALKLKLGKLENDYSNAHMLRRLAESELATVKLQLIKLKESK